MSLSNLVEHAFVVCAFGENPHIESTIESLEAQTVESKIVLSTSTTSEYLEEICSRHGIEMIVNPDRLGAGFDWNYGYNHAGAKWVTMAHQDDVYDKRFTERVLAVADSYDLNSIQLLYTDYYELRNSEHVTSNTLLKGKRILNFPLRFRCLNGNRFVKRRVLSLGCPICCPAVTFNTTALGPSIFDTKYVNSCDYKTWVDLAGGRGRFVYIPEMLMGHRIYEGSATTKNLGENIRKREDQEILSMLWPKCIAAIINHFYAYSEKSNVL